MLERLDEAERLLPGLLGSPDGWKGLYADTERPHLTRVWRQWGSDRISLHLFGPCAPEEVFPHGHEWDSAIVIKAGSCRVLIDWTSVPLSPFEPSVSLVLGPGSRYAMVGPQARHGVMPERSHGYASVMVSGPPRYPQHKVRVNTPSRSLTAEEIMKHLAYFQGFYVDAPS